MKIWYLSAHDTPRGRSARTYDYSLELVRRGHDVTFFTNSYCHWTHKETLRPDERWRVEFIDGIRVVWLRTYPYAGNGLGRGLNMISNAWRCLQASAALPDRPDVVVGPSVPLGTAWAGARIARAHNAAFIFEVRDVWPTALVDDGGLSPNSPVYFAFRAIEKQMYRKADRISATMPFLFDHVAESGGDRGKVQWIPNGVNLDRFKGFDTYDGGRDDRLRVMYVGGLGVAHDVLTIVHAAAILEREMPGVFQFTIVGNGPRKASCLDLARQENVTNIEFRDSVDKADVPKLQADADVLIAAVTDSAAYRFGLNLNKIFDYFASARPVVFSGNAPNDPVRDSGCGLTVKPERPNEMASALRELHAAGPERRREMGRRGRAYIETNYQMSVLGATMEQLMLDAVASRNGMHPQPTR